MTSKHKFHPLDRAASTVIVLLSLVIVAMLLLGSQALPSVRTFSWQGQRVKANDVAFVLTFNQPVVPESVEENLVIEPVLFGKVSWAGRRMAYTLDAPAPYGESYKLSLPKAQALSGQAGFEPFESEFETRDRAFVYIGAEGEETDRLVLFNLTTKKKTLLTPAGQTVLDFQPYPERDRILFSAVDTSIQTDRIASAQIYSITTGLGPVSTPPFWQFWQKASTAQAGDIDLILNNENFQNLKFDLAANGETIVVQRVSQSDPADFGPWIIKPGAAPRKLNTEPGGDFRIAPDSVSLLLQQGQGTAVIDLEPELDATESNALLLDFLPEYGLTLDIADDGSAAALVNFNQDNPEERFTQSLFWVSNRGEEKLLLQTDGAILSAEFNENNEILYCVVNRLLRNNRSDEAEIEDLALNELDEEDAIGLLEEDFSFSPYLTAINVKTGQEQKLLEMPPQPELTVSLSPDGLAILFDEALINEAQTSSLPEDYKGPTSRLWLLPLFATLEERVLREPIPLLPTELDIAGRHPTWLP
ncbi:MAG: hypothetical protein WA783_20135 [Phormidesmis sp.]